MAVLCNCTVHKMAYCVSFNFSQIHIFQLQYKRDLKITPLLRCLNFWSAQLIRLSHIFFQVWNIRIQYSKTITRSFSKVSSISHQGLWKVSTRSQEGVRKWLDSFRVLCPRVANSQLTFYWEYSQTFFRETTASNLFLSSYQ